MIRKFCMLLFLVLISISIGKGLHSIKDGFSSRRIQGLDVWVQEDLNDEAKEVLRGPFHYIGRGRQCFAFASADEKYVLKFPRTDIYTTPFWLKVLPFHVYREKLERDHKRRKEFVLNSFRISFDELHNQTAMVATHLGKSFSNGYLTVIDQLGCEHTLPIRSTSFVLQYKHPILMKEFIKALADQDKKRCEKILDSLLDVIVIRAQKGILNRDRSFLKNYGFDGERAYQIDVGSFFKIPNLPLKEAYQKSIRDSIDPVQEWLTENAPEMLDYLNSKLKDILSYKLINNSVIMFA